MGRRTASTYIVREQDGAAPKKDAGQCVLYRRASIGFVCRSIAEAREIRGRGLESARDASWNRGTE